MLPYFSVVIPCYNRADTVLPTLKSVQDQYFSDFECIIVDDGSNDAGKLKSVIESLEDPRFRYIWRENGGGSAARNTGIAASKGKYIAFLDSDDLFISNKLNVVYNFCKNEKYDVYSSYVLVDRGNGVWGKKPSRPFFKNEHIDEYLFSQREELQTSSLIVKREIAKSILFYEGLAKGQDLDFVIRLYRSQAKFFFIENTLAVWNDKTYQEERVSHKRSTYAIDYWLDLNKNLLSKRAYYGYLANIKSFEIAQEKPLTALKYIIWGSFYGHVPIKRSLHSSCRAFIPRNEYKKIVDYYLFFKMKMLSVRNYIDK